MILITGGARSGKSTFAENIAKKYNKVLYIATAINTDEEMDRRIKKHQSQRPSNWDTYEGYFNLDNILLEKGNNYDIILLECITTLLTNLIFYFGGTEPENIDYDEIENKIKNQINSLISASKNIKAKTVFITNEVGLGIVPADKLSRNFRDIAGRTNQLIAYNCEEVYMLVSGLPVKLK